MPIPTLFEQKQIVTILDEAFEEIDRAIANTEKNLANAANYLRAACNLYSQIEENTGYACNYQNC